MGPSLDKFVGQPNRLIQVKVMSKVKKLTKQDELKFTVMIAQIKKQCFAKFRLA